MNKPLTNDVIEAFIQRGDDYETALHHWCCMLEEVEEGIHPEDVLYEYGLEPDFLFDLIVL